MAEKPANDLTAHLNDLNKLAPEARARVSEALKASITKELGTQAGPAMKAAEFSKGAFFSRSRGASMLDDRTLVENAANMDAETFAKFAQNLQTLKGLKGSTSG